MRSWSLSKALLAIALVVGMGVSGAYASGMLTNGLPQAGVTPYTYTVPLTGNELLPADTQLPNGQMPQSESVSVGQLQQPSTVSASNATSFTATASQVSGGANLALLLTGAPTTGQTVTLPSAASIWANVSNASAGQKYLLKVVNVGGTSSGAWTVAAGTGDTITGNTSVPVAGSREYLVTLTSATAVGFQDLGQ